MVMPPKSASFYLPVTRLRRISRHICQSALTARFLKRPDSKNGNKIIDGKLIQQGVGQWRVGISGLGGRPATICAAR